MEEIDWNMGGIGWKNMGGGGGGVVTYINNNNVMYNERERK